MRAARARTFAVVAALATAVPGAALTGSATGAEEEGRKFLNRTVYPDQYRGADWQRGGNFAVVVDGLDNPRQLVWSNQNGLVVAEAGHGNPNNCDPEFGCVGRSGQISRITNPAISRGDNAEVLAEGFISFAGEDGSFAVGADGVDQSRNNRLFVAMTYAPPDVIPRAAAGSPARQADGRRAAQVQEGRLRQHHPLRDAEQPRRRAGRVQPVRDAVAAGQAARRRRGG